MRRGAMLGQIGWREEFSGRRDRAFPDNLLNDRLWSFLAREG